MAACGSHDKPASLPSHAALPNKAALARKWPFLRVNRLSGRWRDDATGASGAGLESLLSYLSTSGRMRPQRRARAT
ncbi:hypothetical protein D1O30_12470 [Methylocystis hirsuta]|uniref:Uncharacterized protein n=1 Tax=Methylocystis hirsuta TaxID=369798 RepID=A0A3M9XQK7_9HYPH|nr:hypothetical protein D1O30_12470 [Methylocystis hirsuta]